MSTTLVRKEDVQRKWYVLDAADKPLGRTAVIAANLLRGKLKPDFTPNVDCGDYVIIVNVEKAVLTGRKLEEKYYRRHSGWIGGLKETKYKTLMAFRPSFRLDRRSEGNEVQDPHGRASRVRHGAGRQGHAPEEHHRQNCHDSSEAVQGSGAHPCCPEARSLDAGLIRR